MKDQTEKIAHLAWTAAKLTPVQLNSLIWVAERRASGERLLRTKGGVEVDSAHEFAASLVDGALDRVEELLRHGDGAIVSPKGIRGKR